jgi:hypothetical protein
MNTTTLQVLVAETLPRDESVFMLHNLSTYANLVPDKTELNLANQPGLRSYSKLS